jgi:hypothetical protein
VWFFILARRLAAGRQQTSCDLERRQIVTLLPDREVATVQTWLTGHPDIKVLSPRSWWRVR